MPYAIELVTNMDIFNLFNLFNRVKYGFIILLKVIQYWNNNKNFV